MQVKLSVLESAVNHGMICKMLQNLQYDCWDLCVKVSVSLDFVSAIDSCWACVNGCWAVCANEFLFLAVMYLVQFVFVFCSRVLFCLVGQYKSVNWACCKFCCVGKCKFVDFVLGAQLCVCA